MNSFILTLLVILVIREVLYHIFIIKPKTNLTGNLARKIEDVDVTEWVKPKIKKEIPEIGFVGNSHVMDAIDPDIIGEITKKKCFNIALYYIPTPNILDILLKFNCFPETLVIDISTRYSMYNPFYEFYFEKLNTEINEQNTLKNKISYFIPSIFIPKQFRPIEYRALKKIFSFMKNSDNYIGRYSPFRMLISFDWSLNINSNHRIVTRGRKISKFEKKTYYSILDKTINETKELCSETHPKLEQTFNIWNKFLSKAKKNNCKVFIIRLPMDEKLINYENNNCIFYFNKIKTLCEKYLCTYIDLNKEISNLSFNDFYIDGQHTTHNTAIKISHYLSKQILQK